MSPVRSVYAIKMAGLVVPLQPGETLLGRGSSCDVVVPSEKASRVHARILVEESGVYLEDLKSTNGVFVNDEQVARVQLALRDRIRIGDSILSLVLFEDLKLTRRGDPTPEGFTDPSPTSDPPPQDVTKEAHAFEVVGPLVEKMLVLGRLDEAERLLRTPLQRVLGQVEQGMPIDLKVTTSAAVLAVRLAEATGKPHFIDLVLRMHAALARPLPLPIIDDLYRVLRAVRGIDQAVLRNYVERLEAHASAMGPTERFALKRIVGLRQLSTA